MIIKMLVNLCKESPTINELSDIMASSHQNVKQILLKLEKKGFVRMIADEQDKRKQRVILTKKAQEIIFFNFKKLKILVIREKFL